MSTQQMLYTIEELAEATGITPRTIRYYTTEGLMPTPETRGRYALYSDAHLQRLQLIVQLKAAYLPLGTIKAKLEQVSNQNVNALLTGETPLVEDTDSEEDGNASETETASAYISRVLSNRRALSSTRVSKMPASFPGVTDKSSSAEAVDAPGEAWRHLDVLPGVELHFRVPVSSRNQANVDKLIQYAKSLGKKD